ncbi:MAG: hypothetical protein US49_C0001G0051 [candidate division TM6 bacterium GW2011_GWF2_37_49]|nr:MAG: hypothetical protein US49_C0001G0051 [candidate division TM6 bacterium GW2011_GWF2_37_49]
MFNKQKILDFFNKILKSGASPQKLAISCSIGIYIAFSPFPGLHAVMIFLIHWILGLNLPMMFLATSINNPWTIIPFYSTDYFFGYWLVHNVLGRNPDFCISLAKVFGSGKICLVSFFVGGNVLGLAVALISYPFASLLFKRLLKSGKADL